MGLCESTNDAPDARIKGYDDENRRQSICNKLHDIGAAFRDQWRLATKVNGSQEGNQQI